MKKKMPILFTSLLFALSVGSLSSCGFTRSDTDDLLAVKEITTSKDNDGNIILTITYNNDDVSPLTVTIPSGKDGKDGIGISSISSPVPSEDGSTTNFTIYFTDDSKLDVSIPNGVSVVGTETIYDESGEVVTGMVFIFSDGSKSGVIPIPRGEKGKDGRGIASIDKVTNPDKSVTLTIWYSDGTSSEVLIPSPEKGEKGDTGEAGKTWYYGDTEPSSTLGNDGDFYFHTAKTRIYLKENGVWKVIASFEVEEVVHTVTFKGEGGIVDGSPETTRSIKHGSYFATGAYGSIPLPYKENYDFLGWSVTKTMDQTTSYFTNFTVVVSDLVLYAIYQAK